MATRTLTDTDTSDRLVEMADWWDETLAVTNHSPRTRATYRAALLDLDRFLARAGMPRTIEGVHREHLEAYLGGLFADGKRPATVSLRYRALQAFYRWAMSLDKLPASPMANVEPPIVPEVPVPVIPDADVDLILRACAGRSFEDRRDTAIVRLFFDTGMRLGELAGLKVDDLDLKAHEVTVLGKGRRPRTVAISGVKTILALRHYIDVRKRHPYVYDPKAKDLLWFGRRGPMTPSGIYQVVRDRAASVGLTIHPHQFRHTAAHAWMARGLGETSLMRSMGWRSRSMLSRYGASAADERARDEARRAALGDRV